MASGQNGKLTNYQVDKMASWQNGKLTKWQVDKMASLQNVKFTKCQVDKMASWQHGKLTKCQVDKMTSWQNVMAPKRFDETSPKSCLSGWRQQQSKVHNFVVDSFVKLMLMYLYNAIMIFGHPGGAMTLSLTTFSVKALSITTFSLMALMLGVVNAEICNWAH
jgi:hypothetical protein